MYPIFVKLQSDRAGENLFGQALRLGGIAFAGESEVQRKRSVASSIMRICVEPGVQVVAQVPVAGPVPPPTIVVRPDAIAS